ncbi:protein RKD4 isoform X1 [Castanea sativa]|uniref:protein RKD4 isoform X1 n=1 Tax=Castanea sativa TaxID=21020 RepID=UPI003F65342E
MGSIQHDIPIKIENPHEFDWVYQEDHSKKNFELPALDSYFDELSDSFPLPYSYSKQLPFTEFQDFEDFPNDFFSMEQVQDFASHFDMDHVVLDQSPVNPITEFAPSGSELSESSVISQSEYASSGKSEEEKGTGSRRKRTALLELDEIQKHFDVPITKAAKEMNVGLTVLKKRCRELNIMRWPHRKIKSLNSLIKNIQNKRLELELLVVEDLGLKREADILEDHKRLLEILPDTELTEEIKRLRQACFKANYKKKRMAIQD